MSNNSWNYQNDKDPSLPNTYLIPNEESYKSS